MWRRFQQVLNRPYPDTEDPRGLLLEMLWPALIVFLVLILFQPFGLRATGASAWWICAVFGGITYLVGLVYYLLLRILPIDRESKDWKFKHWLASVLGLVLCIAMANYAFGIILFDMTEFQLREFLYMLANTFVIAIFPVLVAGLITQNRQLKINLRAAQAIDQALGQPGQPGKPLTIMSKEHGVSMELTSAELRYIESMQNYIDIRYVRNGSLSRETMRNTLADTCRQLCDTKIMRCHRSFMVNTDHVLRAEGNAQGLTLHLDHEITIPVSRTHVQAIRKAITHAG